MTEPVETPTNTTPLDKLTPEIERMWTHLDAAEGASALAEGALSGAEKKLLEAQGEARRTKAEAEDLRLKIGALLLEARKQCKHGDWEEWFKANIPQRSLRDAQKLIKVASTDDPKSAREKEKEKNREAQ